jgi:hypothetical protein
MKKIVMKIDCCEQCIAGYVASGGFDENGVFKIAYRCSKQDNKLIEDQRVIPGDCPLEDL